MKIIILILLSFINLTFLLNVFNVNAGEIHTSEKAKQITNLKIGKFFLECTGNCSKDHIFRDKGNLKFGTNKKVFTSEDYTYNIINDFPKEQSIPHFCHDGKPQIKIGKPIYPYKKANNTFSFFNIKPTAIGVYTSKWGATGWGNSNIYIFDTVTGDYFKTTSDACSFPKFVNMNDGVQYYVNYTYTGFFGAPNFSLVYLEFPSSAKDLKGNILKEELLYSYEMLYNEYMPNGWFSPRELKEIEKLFTYWKSHGFKTNSNLFDYGQTQLLKRFVVMIGLDILTPKGIKEFKNYLYRHSGDVKKINYKFNNERINLVKNIARKVAQEFAHYFEDYATLNLTERYDQKR